MIIKNINRGVVEMNIMQIPILIDIIFLGEGNGYKDEFECINQIKRNGHSDIFKINNVNNVNFDYDGTLGFSKSKLLDVLNNLQIKNTTLCFIDCPLEGNYFRKKLSRNISIVTFYQAREIYKDANVPIAKYIFRHLYKSTIRWLLELNDNESTVQSHPRTKGCLYDFCGDDKYHVVLGNKLCHDCETKLRKANLPNGFVDLLIKEFLQNSQNDISLRKGIFISYSHRDAELLKEFKVFLKPIERNGTLTYWDDTKIKPGEKWADEIASALGKAKIAILLISPDFLASDFIMDKEVPSLLSAAEKEGVHIFWIPLSASLYRITPLSNFQAAINPDYPLDNMNKSQRNATFVQICDKLLELIE